jgi:hypothetical protein
MQVNAEVSHPIAALNLNLAGLPNLLMQTRTQIDAKRQSKFEGQAKSLLNNCIKTVRDKAQGLNGDKQESVRGKGGELDRVAETLRLELERLNRLLEKSGSRIDPEEKQKLEFQVAKSVDKCIETLREKVEGLNTQGTQTVVQKWRKLNREVETLTRRLELLHPPNKEALVATLWWMSELGQEADLDLIQKIKVNDPFDGEDIKVLIATAKRRISERAFDPDRGLQRFFGVSPEELMRLLGIADQKLGKPISQHALEAVNELRAIRDSLEDLFEHEEIDRWLHSPNETFDGKTPLEALGEGQRRRVHQLLVRIEEGIPS